MYRYRYKYMLFFIVSRNYGLCTLTEISGSSDVYRVKRATVLRQNHKM